MEYGTDHFAVIFVDDFGSWSKPRRLFDHREHALKLASELNDRVDAEGLEGYGRWLVLDQTTGWFVRE